MVLLRSKPAESQLVVEKGCRHLCSYHTMYGDVMIGISGSMISADFDENGGRLEFRYTMDVNSALLSTNEVHILVEEC